MSHHCLVGWKMNMEGEPYPESTNRENATTDQQLQEKEVTGRRNAERRRSSKRWRILADVLYDLGTGLEVLSPLCPHLFLEVAGLGNLAKGMAVVVARATRLPIYSSFTKEGNLSDLFAKGEAISTVFNVLGIGAGIYLASAICSSLQGKLIDGPLLSVVHVYCVVEAMQAAPINTLNSQRTCMIIANFIKKGKISSPADLRYEEDLLFLNRIIEDAGSVKVGRPLHKVVKPSILREMRGTFPKERFVLSRESKWTEDCRKSKQSDFLTRLQIDWRNGKDSGLSLCKGFLQ